jgi:hypothetical protein
VRPDHHVGAAIAADGARVLIDTNMPIRVSSWRPRSVRMSSPP